MGCACACREGVTELNNITVLTYATTYEELILMAVFLYPGLLPDMDFLIDYAGEQSGTGRAWQPHRIAQSQGAGWTLVA